MNVKFHFDIPFLFRKCQSDRFQNWQRFFKKYVFGRTCNFFLSFPADTPCLKHLKIGLISTRWIPRFLSVKMSNLYSWWRVSLSSKVGMHLANMEKLSASVKQANSDETLEQIRVLATKIHHLIATNGQWFRIQTPCLLIVLRKSVLFRKVEARLYDKSNWWRSCYNSNFASTDFSNKLLNRPFNFLQSNCKLCLAELYRSRSVREFGEKSYGVVTQCEKGQRTCKHGGDSSRSLLPHSLLQ